MFDRQDLYRIFNKKWYESIDSYNPTSEFLEIAFTTLENNWGFKRSGIWVNAQPPLAKLINQGWKIHVSAAPEDAIGILKEVCKVLSRHETSFKFAADPFLLKFLNSKSIPRQSGGKFITIYPNTEQEFIHLMDELYKVLEGYKGPYILSDKRYKDSKVLYYRYGSHFPRRKLGVTGEKYLLLETPNGELIPEKRVPYWNPPSWVSDPFKVESKSDENNDMSLKNGRYFIQKVLKFSNGGGIYLGKDNNNNKQVIIKEARPHTDTFRGEDRALRLKKEYRILSKLSPLGIAPQPIDLFYEWEHLFIVVDYIELPSLGTWTVTQTPLSMVYPSNEILIKYIKKLKKVWTGLADFINICHNQNIICGDLSMLNIFVDEYKGKIKMIDWEGSFEKGVDNPPGIYTPGYSLPSASSEKDDIYALGTLMLGTMLHVPQFFDFSPGSNKEISTLLASGLGLPAAMLKIVQSCLNDKASERPTASEVSKMLKSINDNLSLEFKEELDLTSKQIDTITQDVLKYIDNVVDFRRNDRLYPSDPVVFVTNPISFAYGATGIAYTKFKINGKIESEVVNWILQNISLDSTPPGLYIGISGVAWFMAEIKKYDIAKKLIYMAKSHPLTFQAPDLYAGASGYGLTCLKLYMDTKDKCFLEFAKEVGDWLLKTCVPDTDGCFWYDENGEINLGYGRGLAGIALFLLYLSLVTDDNRFIDTGKKALNYMSSHLRETPEGYLTLPRGVVGKIKNVLLPSWFDGSAGVTGVFLKYGLITEEEKWFNLFDSMIPDLYRKFMIFPNFFVGSAGLGDSLITAYMLKEDKKYLQEAIRIANGILPYQVKENEGTIFPGQQLWRGSTDFATGSSGIAFFLNRLSKALNGEYTESALQLDELIIAKKVAGINAKKLSETFI